VDADLRAIIAAVESGAVPFAKPAEPPPVALLPLETYASVTAALAGGEPRDAVLARHRLTSEAFDAQARAWAQRFQRQPHFLERFKELVRSSAPR
jgi:hypothetical protein